MEDPLKEYLEETVMTAEKTPVCLEVMNGPEDGRISPITADVVLIGRDDKCKIIFRTDKAISRVHCQLTSTGAGEFLLEDLKSTYGTELNGVKIEPGVPTPCKNNDMILIGDTQLLLHAE
jgi:pSer/pThr/pTyr-binding forkhead associated (FHA) protein